MVEISDILRIYVDELLMVVVVPSSATFYPPLLFLPLVGYPIFIRPTHHR